MKKVLIAGVLIAGLLAGTASAYGPFGGGRMGKGAHGGGFGQDPLMLPWLLHGAGLTADQRAKVKDILQSHQATFQSLFTQLRDARQAMVGKLLAPGTVTADDLAPQMKQVAQLRDQLMHEGLKVALEVRTVLTPEQLSKASDVRQRMTELRAEMRKLIGDGALDDGGE